MYTFLTLVGSLFLLSAVIFRGQIKKNIFGIFLIMFLGTTLGMTIVNGIQNKRIPYVKVLEDTTLLDSCQTYAIIGRDSLRDTMSCMAFIKYRYVEADTIDGAIINKQNRLDIGLSSWFYPSELDFLNKLSVYYLSETDTVPRLEEWRETKLSKSPWVSTISLPQGRTYYRLYLPKDSTHQSIVKFLNTKFYDFSNQTFEL